MKFLVEKKRNIIADLLKGIAVILMIQVHIVELFAQQEIFESSLGKVLLFLGGPPAAPVFMTVMGYFIAKQNKSLRENLIRGLKLIVIGFALNIGLNFHLLIKIIKGEFLIDPWPYVFGVDILFLAGLSIIIISILKDWVGKNPAGYIIIIIVVLGIQEFVPYPAVPEKLSFFTSYFYSGTWWSYFPLIPWLAYPLTGVLVKLSENIINNVFIKQSYRITAFIISGIVFSITISYGIEIASDLKQYYHHSFLYFLFTLNFMIFIYEALRLILLTGNNVVLKFIQWIGVNVTIIYVIQWLIIGNIATAIYKTQNLVQISLWFLTILLATIVITYFYTLAIRFIRTIKETISRSFN